jgi:dephospho-CoA kinase
MNTSMSYQKPTPKTNKWILGLTGGICSGKTTVSNYLKKLGCYIIDADVCARKVVKPNSKGIQLIKENFGEEFITTTGELNRKKLREHVFNNNTELEKLNNILHPLIKQEIEDSFEKADGEYIVFVAPLLFENKLECYVDRVLCMSIDKETQISRTIVRDNCTKETALNIIKAQLPLDIKIQKSDDVLVSNRETVDELYDDITKLHKKYLKLSQEKNQNEG